jgi:hypothetical protein
LRVEVAAVGVWSTPIAPIVSRNPVLSRRERCLDKTGLREGVKHRGPAGWGLKESAGMVRMVRCGWGRGPEKVRGGCVSVLVGAGGPKRDAAGESRCGFGLGRLRRGQV